MPCVRLQRRWSTVAPHRAALLALLMILSVGALGCSTYSDRIRDAQMAFAGGQVEQALHHVNDELEVEELDEEPLSLGDENTLFLLERATMLQAIGHYDSAARDMVTVDDRLEWVDIQSDRGDQVLQFIYSDSAGAYTAPPHERLVLNAMNMINFMAMGRHSSARVEARRFDVLQRYFLDDQSAEIIADILGMGNYLAGAAFEADRQFSSAARFYTAAYLHGTWPEEEDRLLDLLAMTGYRGGGLGELTDGAQELFERAGQRQRPSRDEYRDNYLRGDTLVVVQTGMVPYLKPQRLGMERAIVRSLNSPYGPLFLDSDTSRRAHGLYAAGTMSWINTTEMSRQGLPSHRSVTLEAGGQQTALASPINLSSQVEKAWEAISAAALAAAITRAVARLAAGQGARKATQEIAKQSERAEGSAQALGWVAGLVTQGTLSARDRPDTRSWTTLASDVHLVRMQLPEGQQRIQVRVNGRSDHWDATIDDDSFQLFNFSRLR